jgi:tight adherence protein C
MTPSVTQLQILSAILLVAGLLLAAGLLLGRELRHARSARTIEQALRQRTAAPRETPSDVDEEGRARASELPSHWLESRLGRMLVANEDRRLIDQCGYDTVRAQLVFLVARAVLALAVPALVYAAIATGLLPRHTPALLAVGAAVGFMAPKWWLGRLAAARRKRVAHELPLFVDLLRLLQGVGLSLDQSLQIMSKEFSHVLRVLGSELEIANRHYGQGRSREHSLQRLAGLHDNEGLAGLVALLVQVDRHGGAVQEPLRQYGERLREHRRSELKEHIGKITVKMTGVMVLTLLPALIIVAAGPGFLAVARSLGAMGR